MLEFCGKKIRELTRVLDVEGNNGQPHSDSYHSTSLYFSPPFSGKSNLGKFMLRHNLYCASIPSYKAVEPNKAFT